MSDLADWIRTLKDCPLCDGRRVIETYTKRIRCSECSGTGLDLTERHRQILYLVDRLIEARQQYGK